MFANLDRAEFVALLRKLGSESDAEVLTAARDLHAKVTVAGVAWEDLLVPEPSEEEEEESAPDTGEAAGKEEDAAVLTAPDADTGAVDEAGKAEALSLIEAMGKLHVGAATKEELADYKREIAEGEFQQMDLRYLRALHKRLSK